MPPAVGSPTRSLPKRPGSSPRRGWTYTVATLLVIGAVLVGIHVVSPAPLGNPSGGPIRVVAAENFWGSLVSQLGGTQVSVLSIVSDPNADPHDYESNTTDATAIAKAQLVILNGAGYDDWCAQLIAASAPPGQRVLNVAALLGLSAGTNPHFWYGASYVNATIAAMFSDLVAIEPTQRGYFAQQYAALNASLATVWNLEGGIRARFAGTPVASTETIFADMANSSGLDLVSPWSFMQAVAEGNDPSAQSVTEFENQLASGSVVVLVYNEQTVTPLTDQMRTLASQHNVSVVGVTETIQPPSVSFETWMESELVSLENGLNQRALGA